MKKTWIKALEVTFANSLSQTCRLLFDVSTAVCFELTAVMPVSWVGICAYCSQFSASVGHMNIITVKPFSHDEKNPTFLAKFSQCLRNITKWASCERTVMFYMSYIPCEIFANIEKFCRTCRSGPTTKSYASVIFRLESCSLPRVKRHFEN